ncbi:hypothetical protein ACIBG7_08645 [Nonomuraea sp. NPDC050328]
MAGGTGMGGGVAARWEAAAGPGHLCGENPVRRAVILYGAADQLTHQ